MYIHAYIHPSIHICNIGPTNPISKRKKHVKHLHEVLTPKEETDQCTYVNRDVNACKNILYIAKYWLMNQKRPEEFKRKIIKKVPKKRVTKKIVTYRLVV